MKTITSQKRAFTDRQSQKERRTKIIEDVIVAVVFLVGVRYCVPFAYELSKILGQ